MTIEQRIEKYYLDRLNMYSDELGKAIETVLGTEFRKLYDSKKDSFLPVFTASKSGLEYYLENPLYENEKEVIKYLLDKLDEDNKEVLILSSKFEKEKADKMKYLNGGDGSLVKHYFSLKHNKEVYYAEIDVFDLRRDGFCNDFLFIYSLLSVLIPPIITEDFRLINPVNDFFIKYEGKNVGKQMYMFILSTIVLQIIEVLRQSKISILDDIDEIDIEKASGSYKMVSPKFVLAFKDLLPLFLVEPKKFIEIVGENNFKVFTIASLDSDCCLDIDEIINIMLAEREKHVTYQIMAMNRQAILSAKNEVDKKKKADASEFVDLDGYDAGLEQLGRGR